ncbi:NmrA-like family-domain-containing protein [Ilyonectria destructans]|nr:NmrA-like family-domain-containing protein [Ilyonectria destructans]
MAANVTVALAGATGSLGSAVLKELLVAGVPVTVLSRKGSEAASKLPSNPNQTIKEVDYAVEGDLVAALDGVDVVVSTLGTESISIQPALINAAITAGVKRFIPSEFGSDTANQRTRNLPVYSQKVKVQDALVEKAKQHPAFSYTWVFNNAFLDWGIQAGFIINAKDHSATLYDGGDRPFSATRLSTIGKSVVGILTNLEATKNRGVYIHDGVVTQNGLIAVAKKIDPQEWTTTAPSTADLEASGYEELTKANPNIGNAMYGFLSRAIWGEGYGGDFTGRVENALLGLPILTETEVEDVVKDALAALPDKNNVQF